MTEYASLICKAWHQPCTPVRQLSGAASRSIKKVDSGERKREEVKVMWPSKVQSIRPEPADYDFGLVQLNATERCEEAIQFERELSRRIVNQEEAVKAVSDLYQVHLAGLATPSRPVGTLLFLGPTGSGKTRVVEAAAEIMFGDCNAITKVDCAEFQHSHEISKLIGSPPGYLGHRETQ